MAVKIDVIYQDGEVIAFRNPQHPAGKLLTLVRNLATAVEFRFCNPAGEPEEIIAPESYRNAQALLSWRDRLLASTEENITFYQDEAGFQVLRIDYINIDTVEMRNVLADSYLELEPKLRGKADCELSIAVYSSSSDRLMQLFFTLDVQVKNPVLP